jgi:drug/metabolite transporter (DMT)-like permease
MRNINTGILLMMLVAVYQSIMSVIVKLIIPYITTGVQLLAYYMIPLLFLLPIMFIRSSDYKTKHFRLYLLRGIFASSSVFCFFYASQVIPLSVAAVLFNMTPVFIPLIVRIFLNEVTSKQVVCGIGISLGGVFFIIHPGFGGFFSFSSLIGLASGILMAVAQVMLRHLIKTNESSEKIVFYLYLTSTIYSAVIILTEMLISSKKILVIHEKNHAVLVLGGLLGLGIISLTAQRILTKAFQYMPAAKLVPFLYISIPVSSLLGWVIWQQQLTINLLIGSLLIIGGVLFITFDKTEEKICYQDSQQFQNFLNR